LPPFSVVCFNCAPKDLDYLLEHKKLYHQKLFFWSLQIKKRDKNKCRICDALNWSNHDEIQAHHIFPVDLFPELQFLLDNGITLCNLHHKALHYKQFNKIKDVILESVEQTK